MGPEKWIFAAVALVGGFVIGGAAAGLVRRQLEGERRSASTQQLAEPAAQLVFWLLVAVGLVTAIGFAAPDTLDPVPDRLVEWLPNALAALLFVLIGQVLSVVVASAVGRAMQRATGKPNPMVERILKAVIVGGTGILALAQLGVDTTVINLLVAGLVFGVAGAFALLAGLGGRQVASHLAAGRALRGQFGPGTHIAVDGISGTVEEVRPAVVVLRNDDGERVVIPNSTLLEHPLHLS